MQWYQGELLNMALDVGYRLLPAFNSTTGLPHPRINLKHGIKSGKVKQIGETCTACAGTMILEFAALSRLSGEAIFEEKAAAAMDVLWGSRHRQSNLVGNVLNINTGDWIRRDSGVGAGIDSYYEYVAKAYVLLGDEKYLDRWNTHCNVDFLIVIFKNSTNFLISFRCLDNEVSWTGTFCTLFDGKCPSLMKRDLILPFLAATGNARCPHASASYYFKAFY